MYRNLFWLAMKNLRGRGKKLGLCITILLASLMIIVVSHVGIDCYKDYIQKTLVDIPMTKCLRVASYTRNANECKEQMIKLFEGDSRVSGFVTCYEAGSLEMVEPEITDKFQYVTPVLNVCSYHEFMDDYMITDVDALEGNEAILPKYMWDSQEDQRIQNGYLPYVDMSQLIGQTIEVEINQKREKIQVVGVYDSLKAADTQTMYMNYDTLK